MKSFLFRVRYDSDFIIISDYSVFEDVYIFLYFFRRKLNFGLMILNDFLEDILIFILFYLLIKDFCMVLGVC